MTECLTIDGPAQLAGEVTLSGAKNAALPIVVASALVGDQFDLRNVPDLLDVRNLLSVLQDLGAQWTFVNNRLTIDSAGLTTTTAGKESSRKIRYSLLLMGALLARYGHVRVAPPGGCKLGLRKYDIHLHGLRKLGAEIDATEDYIDLRAPNGLVGAEVDFYFPSMTATENVLLGAVLARGTTAIRNAQRDPEVVDFARFLNAMGARISGAGSDCIVVEGVTSLHGVSYEVMPDRMELVTLIAASVLTRSPIRIRGARLVDIQPEADALRRMGVQLQSQQDAVVVTPPRKLAATDIEALIWPHVHSDVQPIFTAMACLAGSTARVTDLLFGGRFLYVPELSKMGADVRVEKLERCVPSGERALCAVIEPVGGFKGARVTATDIRGGAALLVAAVAADGRTTISNIDQIDRGYERLDDKLRGLGAKISRTSDEEAAV